jgi:hypothetical protein
VSVTNHSKGAANASVALELPSGWRAKPDRAAVSFSREDEATTVRFTLSAPPPQMLKGDTVVVKARVSEAPRTTIRAISWSSTRIRRAVTCCVLPT